MDGTHNQLDLLSRLLDVASLRHRAIAQNVANVNTPAYKRLDVTFDRALERALAGGDATGLEHARARVVEDPRGPERADGNNVDINIEMAQLDRNTLIYRTLAQILAFRAGTVRSIITGS
jgi:flagellar basal-body rod protein FlgB